MSNKDALQEVFENPEKFACGRSMQNPCALDAGLHATGGWMAGRALVLTLLSGFADVSFGNMEAGGNLVPTLDVFLDNTVAAAEALRPDEDGAYRGASSPYRFLLAEKAPETGENLMVAAPQSLVAHLFAAGIALPREVQNLLGAGFCKEEISWGFSSMPIILRSKDAAAEAALQAQVQKAGQLVSVWLRGADEELKEYLTKRDGNGELRLHNLLTGNTFVGGKVDETALARLLK